MRRVLALLGFLLYLNSYGQDTREFRFPVDFQEYFQKRPYVWAGESIILNVLLPVTDTRFFYMSYQINDVIINKRLGVEDGKLILSKSEIFKVDGESVDPNNAFDYRLFYYNQEAEQSRLLTTVDFVLVSEMELKTLKNRIDINGSDQYEQLAAMLSELHGFCDPDQLRLNEILSK